MGGWAVGRVGWGGVQVGRFGVVRGEGGAQAPLTSPCPQSNHTITKETSPPWGGVRGKETVIMRTAALHANAMDVHAGGGHQCTAGAMDGGECCFGSEPSNQTEHHRGLHPKANPKTYKSPSL